MPKYRIHIDKPLPDPKRIDSFKDFNLLYQQYQISTRFEFWRNLYRKPTYFASIIVIISIGIIVFEAANSGIAVKQTAFINPPIPPKDIQPVAENYTNMDSLIFSYEDGSRIIVPPQAFSDQDGNTVEGNVELRYREFRDVPEIFIGGIPMQYDTAGQKHTLESAGMLEITAFQNGQPLVLREGKKIEVQYISPFGSRDFSVYYLDTLERNWVYKSKDEVKEIAMATPPRPGLEYLRDLEADTLLTKNVRIPPARPQPLFYTSLSLATLPEELKGKEGMFWAWIEIADYANPWEGTPERSKLPLSGVKRYRMPGVYELTFSTGNEDYPIIARPVEGIDRQADADQWYENQMADYRTKMLIWEQQRQDALDRHRALEEARRLQNAWNEEMKKRNSDLASKTYNRKFIIEQLGITQIGRIVSRPPAQKLVSFSDPAGEPISQQLIQQGRAIYTVIPKINTIFRCEIEDEKEGIFRLYFDPDQQTPVWSSTSEEDLLLLEAPDFVWGNNDIETTEIVIIPLEHIQTRLTNSDSLKQILFDSMIILP